MAKGRFEKYRGKYEYDDFIKVIETTRATQTSIDELTKFFVNGVRQKDISKNRQSLSNRIWWFLVLDKKIDA